MKTRLTHITRAFALAMALTTLTAGCGGNDTNDTQRQLANKLFEQSVRLAGIYIDSMSTAKDSASVLRLAANYEDRVTRLNFKYPSETFIHFTEDQNDTLAKQTERLVKLKTSKLEIFGGKGIPGDTVNDGVPPLLRRHEHSDSI